MNRANRKRIETLESQSGRPGQTPPSAADWEQVEQELSAPALDALHKLFDLEDGSEMTEAQEIARQIEIQVILTMDAADPVTLARWTRLLKITGPDTEDVDLEIDNLIRKLIADRAARLQVMP